jgi:hypothetical protein
MSETAAASRQLDYFRYRVQQRITLNDDELDRLAHQLQTFKSEISRANDQLRHVDSQLAIRRALHGQRTNSPYGIITSRIQMEHIRRLQELQREQAAEIEALQREFQDSVASLASLAKIEAHKQMTPLTADIQKTSIEIEKLTQAKFTATQTEADYFDDSALDSERAQAALISGLQNRILALNAERSTDLAQVKMELSRYAEVLEEMEQQFANQSARLCHGLVISEQRYLSELSRMKESQQHKLRILRAKRKEVNMRASASVHSLHRMEHRRENTMTESVREMQLIKLNAAREPQIAPVGEEEAAEVAQLSAELAKLSAQRDARVAHLRALRDANEKMKREIGRLQFEFRFRRH